MIAVQRGEEPDILKTKGKAQTAFLCSEYQTGKREFDFNRNIYAHRSVKEVLFEMQYGKCCFCETFTVSPAHSGSGDVEHFRPKTGWQQSRLGDLQKPGYYWLVYEWDNLLLSCETCNRSHKKTCFHC